VIYLYIGPYSDSSKSFNYYNSEFLAGNV